MSEVTTGLLTSLSLFVGMLALHRAGHGLGRRLARQGGAPGTGPIEGAIFALLGLLIAFGFSGAAARYDARRALIVDESNDVGTAWLRLDLLAPEARGVLRGHLRRYLDARIETHEKLPDEAAAAPAMARATELQGAMWAVAVEAVRSPAAAPGAAQVLLPSLTQMFDTGSTRLAIRHAHPPDLVFFMLVAISLMAALFAGIGVGQGGEGKSWLHGAGFALAIALTHAVIIDLEFPRQGLVRLDQFDRQLVSLRSSMGED